MEENPKVVEFDFTGEEVGNLVTIMLAALAMQKLSDGGHLSKAIEAKRALYKLIKDAPALVAKVENIGRVAMSNVRKENTK